MEVSVQVVERWIVAALRGRVFYSLEELNKAISELLEKINSREMRHLGKSRRQLFDEIDRPALKALPERPYEYGEWKKATVNIDYHVEYDNAYYSVPYAMVQMEVWIRATESVVEVYKDFERIFAHRRSYIRGKYQTEPSHRPVSHQEHAKWTPERIVSWAKTRGDVVGEYVKLLIESKSHPEQGFRAALGVIRLSDKYGGERLRQACLKASHIGSYSYRTLSNMLKNGMEKMEIKKPNGQIELFSDHENVRGEMYYH